jgi:hypothetical protein
VKDFYLRVARICCSATTQTLFASGIRVNPYNHLSLTSKGLTMSRLIALIKALIPHFKSQSELDEAYLCGAANVFDLERRMRLVDIAARDNARSLIFGNKMP